MRENGGSEGQIKRSGHRAVWSVFADSLSVSGAVIMEVWAAGVRSADYGAASINRVPTLQH